MGSPEFKENMRPKNTPEETGEKLSNGECYDKVWDMMKMGEDLLKEGKIDEADATVKKLNVMLWARTDYLLENSYNNKQNESYLKSFQTLENGRIRELQLDLSKAKASKAAQGLQQKMESVEQVENIDVKKGVETMRRLIEEVDDANFQRGIETYNDLVEQLKAFRKSEKQMLSSDSRIKRHEYNWRTGTDMRGNKVDVPKEVAEYWTLVPKLKLAFTRAYNRLSSPVGGSYTPPAKPKKKKGYNPNIYSNRNRRGQPDQASINRTRQQRLKDGIFGYDPNH